MKTALIALILAAQTASATEWVPANTPCPRGMFARTVALTGSMRPAFWGGEIVYCEPYVGQPVAVGDVIALDTARSGPRFHRVVAVNSRTVWTAGDACRRGDGPSDRARIMYIARFVVRAH